MIFIGPTLKSGIGQHTFKYTNLFPDAKHYEFGQELPECDHAFMFVIPVPATLAYISYVKTRAKKVSCMTVCETETVHEDYGKIFKHFDTVLVPSEFCKRVLSKQFPNTTFKIVHAHIPLPSKKKPYTFYHIGNILDDRKNFKSILEAFVRLNDPNTRLVVKATCNQDVSINLPRVKVINGLISDEEMEDIHTISDCYVSFSKSEGVGMGAVEAALHDKPVIITDYGGAAEYIKTPYTIECELQELERDDFLFKKGMVWGKPNPDQLLEFMRDASQKELRFMDHGYTRNIVGKDAVLEEFLIHVIGEESTETD
jgi:glycosyltransferase involved in cell wall biosynthesis